MYVHRFGYDHAEGVFTSKKKINSKKYIVLCGLHSLYLPQLRNVLDLKIFMDTDDELRKYWKVHRDCSNRGYSKEEIVSQIEKRYPDAEKYVYPQKEYADVVITYFDRTLPNCYVENHNVRLSVKFNLKIDIDVEPIVSSFKKLDIEPEWKISDDFMHQEIIFDGADLFSYHVDFARIAEQIIPQYEDFFTYAPEWGNDVEGVIQLLLLFMISKKMRVEI